MSLPRYPEYKESGLEWLGEVPAHWDVRPLKYVASHNDEVVPDNTTDDFLIRYVEISDVDEINGISGFTEQTFGDAPSRARRRVRDGDVLISTVRTYLRAISPVRNPPDNLVASTGFAVIRPYRNECDTNLLGYVVRSEWFVSEVIADSVGVSYPAINASDLVRIKIPVQPMSEQAQIGSFLDHETARIDALIAEQQRLIELLKEKRQAVISRAATKGLDPNIPMKNSSVEWLGEVPAHWNVGALRWYADIQGGIAKGKDYQGRDTVALPYLRVANVQDGFVDLTEVKEIAVLEPEVERYSLRAGDVLMNEGGDNDKLGRGAIWKAQISPCLHQNHVFAIRPTSYLLPEWLATFTQSLQARAYFFLNSKQSTNLASISATNVMSLTLPIPPVREQGAISEHLDRDQTNYESLVDVASSMVELLKERRSALISAAVTGKIDVRGWRPPVSESNFSPEVRAAGLEAVS